MKTLDFNEKTEELPEWFCLIQTDRDYFIKRYFEIQDGKKPINYAVCLSFILQNMWYLFYRKYAFFPLFLYSFISGILLIPLQFLTPVIKIYFENNLEKILWAVTLYTLLVIFFIAKSVCKSYNTWYLEHIQEKYKKGYRPIFYKDTSPILKYFSFLGFGICLLLAYLGVMKPDVISMAESIIIADITKDQFMQLSSPLKFLYIYMFLMKSFISIALLLRGIGAIFDWIKLKRHKNETTLHS